MKLLIYCPNNREKMDRLLNTVRQAVPSPELQLCHDIGQLFEAPRNYDHDWDVFLALVSTTGELVRLREMAWLIRGRRTILLLEQRNSEITKSAVALGPSYFTDYPLGLQEVSEVLAHLTAKTDRAGRGGKS